MKTRQRLLFNKWMPLAAAVALTSFTSAPTLAAELKLFLPLNRTAYQDNEWIDISAIRSSVEPLPAGDLALKLMADGSEMSFLFAVNKVAPEAGTARSVEHLHVNGWLLRPGSYTIEVTCDGARANTNLTVHSHIRQSDFKLINWGRAKGKDQLPQGEQNLGFNLFYGGYSADEEANFIRAGVDFMANCVMSGGHQMDLRSECDWSDPYVIRGGTRRVARRAFIDRTRPNVPGVHFYDEPGLTWSKNPETGDFTPHAVPWQARSWEAAFGQPSLRYDKVDPNNPADAARWEQWARWKLGFMDAAWKDAQFGVSAVKPEYISVTQSQYGYSAFTDGYYFNVVRSLPVISGHGGYHDFGPGYFNPSMFLEFARAHDLARPNWYLPTWFGNITADEFRLEQYLSFQCNIQGMMAPPDIELGSTPEKIKAAQGVVECNHLMARLGPIFNTMPVTRPPVALLFSLSQFLHTQTLDRTKNYAHDTAHGRNVPFAYLAGKLLQHQFMPVLDEDILDGTLTAQHQAIVLTSLDYLAPEVIAGLERFAEAGRLVLLTADCTVMIKGAVKLDVAPAWPDTDKIAELKKAGQTKEIGELTKMRQALAGARKLADAIRPHLEKAGIRPPLTSSEPGIVVTRQAAGDIEYLFAVNATHDPAGDPMLGMKAVTATLGLEADDGPVYDAIHGGEAFDKKEPPRQAQFRFGPGQMRVFARTARPIGGIKVGTPMVDRDYTRKDSPLRVEFSAVLLDKQGGLLCGSVPVRIQVIDPLGTSRHDIYRALDRGTLRLSLPLAVNDPVNDPAGQWRVKITELLNNTWDSATFLLPPARTCAAAAGATARAVSWPEDREHVFRFFRTHQNVTLVKGTNDFNQPAAERLEKILKPWNVTCSIVTAAEVNKPRALTDEEAVTWIGLDYAGKGQIKPGEKNSPTQAGFALQGPAILLGTPEDNPLIKFLAEQKFLPYRPAKEEMPGPGRGYVAWQRDGLGVNQESVTLIAHDAAGMSEAVGTLYEFVAGLEPLTALVQPRRSTIRAASRADHLLDVLPDTTSLLDDRIEGIKVHDGRLMILSHAGELGVINENLLVSRRRTVEGQEYAKLSEEFRAINDAATLAEARKAAPAGRLVKLVSAGERLLAVAYWGGALGLCEPGGALKVMYRVPQDITALAWSGDHLLIGDADGRLLALRTR